MHKHTADKQDLHLEIMMRMDTSGHWLSPDIRDTRGSDPSDTRDTKIYDGYKCALITTRSPEEWKASLNSCLRRFKSGKNVQQDVSLRICGNE